MVTLLCGVTPPITYLFGEIRRGIDGKHYVPDMGAPADKIHAYTTGTGWNGHITLNEAGYKWSGSLPTQVHKIYGSTSSSVEFERKVGAKSYELTDHLGNVRTVVNDVKYVTDVNSDGFIDAGDEFIPEVKSFTDYYAFGMTMPGRKFNTGDYRYGYNGMETDNEVKDEGNMVDFGARIYDPRLGKWLSLDPEMLKLPSHSPYSFAFNSPVSFNDPDGKKPKIKILSVEISKAGGKTVIKVTMQLEVAVAVINKSSVALSKAQGEAIAGNLQMDADEGTYSGTLPEGYSYTDLAQNFFNVADAKNVEVQFDVKLSQKYRYVEKPEDVKADEELLILVDNHQANTAGVAPGGLAHNEMGVATVDIGAATSGVLLHGTSTKGKTGVHEVGHLMNAGDRYTRNSKGQVTSYGPKSTVMGADPNRTTFFDMTDVQDMVFDALHDLNIDSKREKLGTPKTYNKSGNTYTPKYNVSVKNRINHGVSESKKAQFEGE